jgi:asparagine synthase (glutamine-hydrolysing)
MCGIAGTLLFDPGAVVGPDLLLRMTRVIAHRGPDDEGVWASGPVGLGTRRLAVIDLSQRGHQPMSNEDGSIWITFNGEVYNFQELREGLLRKGHVFRSNTDTETIVHLYEEEGIAAIARLRGMFAFALWDGRTSTLFLGRDRLGKKPLFYYQDAKRFVFGSEIKCLLQGGVAGVPDADAIDHYLTFGYVPAPWSAFKDIRKLPPAHYLQVRHGHVSTTRYWALQYTPKNPGSEGALLEEFSHLLIESTRLRMISDVPLGVLLSGGLDSSAIAATMRKLTSGPLKTFSIGFEHPEYDELTYARQVAKHLETDHHELIVRPQAIEMVPRLAWHYNEPFADSSAVPSFAVSELARQSVTVALNGDGGDETWLGYDRYAAAAAVDRYDWIPRSARRAVAAAAARLPVGQPKSTVYRVRRLGMGVARTPLEQYASWITVFDDPAKRALFTPDFSAQLAGRRSFHIFQKALAASDAPTFVEAIAHADVQTYLPDDLLVKMDIASMAHSLEVRSPLLDHHMVEFSARLPVRMKLRGYTQKYLLRRLMKDALPAPILTRPKMGFGVPIDRWFKADLKEMAYDLLLDTRATSRGYFRPDAVRAYLDAHVAGRAHHHTQLWALLMLEVWHRLFIDQSCSPAAPTRCDGEPLATAGSVTL